ncbi:MAG TPA: hypothetical protein VMG12_43835 [Polyangiaceae bacterium]|nr:hypothetical protein [Polyangiaceae bacterium]
MTEHPRPALTLLALTALGALGCREREPVKAGESAPTLAPAAAGATASAPRNAQRDEEHRRLCYDRDRLVQHRALLGALQELRQREERAKTEADVHAAQAHARQQAVALRRQLLELDPTKNNSLAARDLEMMLELLLEAYPSELAAHQRGAAPDGSVADELERRNRSVQSTLEHAAQCDGP